MTDHAAQRDRARRRRETAVGHAGAGRIEHGRRSPPDGGDARPSEDDTLILLFMCCHPALTRAVGDRAHAARRRRPDDRRDRQRVPGARGDDGAADQPREADASRRRACRSAMPTAAERARAARRGAARPLPDLQRGLREQRRAGPAAHRSVERGDPADARAFIDLLPRRRRGRRPARADAAHRRAAPGAHRAGRRADSARRAGSHAVGSRAIAEGVALVTAALSRGVGRRVPAAGGDRRGARRSGARRGHRLAADPRALRLLEADVGQPDGGAQPRDRRGDGRRPGGRARAARRRSTPTSGSPATIASTRCARTCSRWPATISRRSPTTGRRGATTSIPERNYLTTKAARLAIARLQPQLGADSARP